MVVKTASDTRCFIAVGANMPSRVGMPLQTLAAAQDMLAAYRVRITAASRIVRTPAFPPGSGQADYSNAVWQAETPLDASGLLLLLLKVEAEFGRRRRSAWAARPLDLDLIAYGACVSWGYWVAAAAGQRPPEVPPPLILPHPRMHSRRFVLEPLEEIAPDWVHPALGLGVRTLLKRLPAAP